jgi:hypothetical protein
MVLAEDKVELLAVTSRSDLESSLIKRALFTMLRALLLTGIAASASAFVAAPSGIAAASRAAPMAMAVEDMVGIGPEVRDQRYTHPTINRFAKTVLHISYAASFLMHYWNIALPRWWP